MITDPLTIAALIAAITALSFWLDFRFTRLSKVGASLLVIIFGALLSNLGIVPRDSPIYGAVEGPVTSLAIVFLLLSVGLSDLKDAGPKMLGVFLLAALGTALGALVGALLFAGSLDPLTWKLAGTFTGTYTGGSLNFAAVGRGLELPPAIFAAASAADNVTTGIWMGVTLAAPVWLMRRRESQPAGDKQLAVSGEGRARTELHPFFGAAPVSLLDLAVLAAIGLAVMLAAGFLGRWVGIFPEILWLTTLALVLAQVPAVRALRGAQRLGNLGLHFFFAVIGIRSLLPEMVRVGPEVFYYTVVVVGVHGVFLFTVARALGGSIPMIAVASQAAIGGPSTAIALTVSRNWPNLMLPGVAVGLLGYAIGNYSGFGIAHAVRLILGN